MRRYVEYMIYKGDKFVDVGTRKELSERLGIQEKTIIHLNSQTYKKIAKPSWRVAYRVEVDE